MTNKWEDVRHKCAQGLGMDLGLNYSQRTLTTTLHYEDFSGLVYTSIDDAVWDLVYDEVEEYAEMGPN